MTDRNLNAATRQTTPRRSDIAATQRTSSAAERYEETATRVEHRHDTAGDADNAGDADGRIGFTPSLLLPYHSGTELPRTESEAPEHLDGYIDGYICGFIVVPVGQIQGESGDSPVNVGQNKRTRESPHRIWWSIQARGRRKRVR